MVFVPYRDMTTEEQRIQQEIWESVLSEYCPALEDGCQPCDKGVPCDSCHFDWAL